MSKIGAKEEDNTMGAAHHFYLEETHAGSWSRVLFGKRFRDHENLCILDSLCGIYC